MQDVYRVRVGEEELVFETGKVAKQANGSVWARQGDTVILTTACMTDKPREGLDFFPLLVDFEERFYSAGKIPGGFIKREGRPSQTAILSARVIDRSIRSLFEGWMRHDVHVVSTVLSVDQQNPPNILAINAASAALTISDIPWGGPVGAVRIGNIDGSLVVNPTEEMMENSSLELVVSGHADGITMVEAGAQEVPEDLLVDAMELAQGEIKRIVDLQLRMREEIGKDKIVIDPPVKVPEIDCWVEENLKSDIAEAVMIHDKKQRGVAVRALEDRAREHFAEEFPDKGGYISGAVEHWVKAMMRKITVTEKRRADGRKTDELRSLSCEVDVLPKVHGSAVFTRGETQSLATATLGMLGEDDQLIDGLKHNEPNKSFLLHYNFPPYSVGEVRPMRGPGRREIGHGALAERALTPIIPDDTEFPYVVRVVSDILESNGSSSQASICGGSLALMSAGVPIKRHVAGIAMGLIKEGDDVVVLTDIQGLEDHYGDMDFKVAGTREGVTALQMDNKAGGITREILKQALGQAKDARMAILDVMEQAISTPGDLSPNAPRMYTMMINVDKIRDVIGPGGKVIRGITQETGAKVNIDDDGQILIAGASQEEVNAAIKMIDDIVREVQAGEVFQGKVTRLMAFGAFVEVLPGKEGLLHVSEISTHRVGKVEDVFKPGDPVLVMVREIDDMGRINLTRKKILADESKVKEAGLESCLSFEAERDEAIAALPPAPAGNDRRRPGGDDRRRGGNGGRRNDRR
ncbi:MULTISPECIES: polyribonucleotide nucleotidyltransferase [Dethiosulfovibrio]|uniref:Polyribonucleotide nucleotidyltransferase n=2 Tax=Dethiosulfovibrio TaxID=47054 RepID=A0ABS9EQ64_9BACT|nr:MULTISPECIES: polyribonucleotide nucleotidyltransferase [Dethiosulfovibrio]MCF4115008.1 polyribonucleotide nucleotidyltransferase [Dethiosulfovibrio russensis]MCF4143331.1 polyribonucleotide nucleotidyltransferase [Dethiosulfovibrio marinus]MCF4145550.1 polyribonucleotide nucleotidyltransferase [Dethiosulfovibrio acidaminovorans]